MIRAGLRSACLLALVPATGAGAFTLDWPVACTLGDTCYIQQYADRDPGPGARDFTCGPLSYDTHSGTDIALPDLAAMRAGVEVRAAANGTVAAVRDGMPDIALGGPGAPDLDGRDCGNGVRITHDDGWETQYCHLAQGSVAVRPGDRVTSGTPLGRIGLSGRTEFPHLHLSLRKDGATVDPFAPGATDTCGPGQDAALWSDPVPYTPGGLVAAGFADAVPAFDAILAGAVPPPTDRSAPLVLWAHYFGNRAGDVMALRITGPAGVVMTETVTLERTQARGFRAVGKRAGAGPWPPGTYTGEIALARDGAVLGRRTVTLDLP